MTWWMVISGAIALLLVLMALGMPLFAAFLVMNVTGVLILFGFSTALLWNGGREPQRGGQTRFA